MLRPDFETLMRKFFEEEILQTSKSKGTDYTKGSKDALSNFKDVGQDLGLDPKQVWAVYCSKHWAAIMNYVKTNGQSESEPIRERIKDVILYNFLLLGLIEEQEQQQNNIQK